MRKAAQLLTPTAAGTSDATLFTSESGGVTIMRHIRVCNTAGSPATYSIAIGGTTATAANCIASGKTVAANSTNDEIGYFVLPASTAVHGVASAVTVTFEISGEISEAGG